MIRFKDLLRGSYRCIQAGPSLASKWRRFHYAPLSLWLRHPRQAALFVAVRPYTMLPYVRMSHLYALADLCNRERIPGAFVQCGVWKGGSAAVLADRATQEDRSLFLFDSFQGCPTPGPEDVSMRGRRGVKGEAAADQENVEGLFARLGISAYNNWKKRLHIVPGWFAETVPAVAPVIGAIALLHLDGDWYESTKVCMQNLYPLVVKNGCVIVDDYFFWKGAQKAVGEYLCRGEDPRPAIHRVNHAMARWRKP